MTVAREHRIDQARLFLAELFRGDWTERLANFASLAEEERIALIYRFAYGAGLAPTTTIALMFDITYNAAAKRVQRARAAGFLSPTERGRKKP